MRNPMIFAKGAVIFLLLFLCGASLQARAQNQTPANVALVGWTDPDTGLTWAKADNGSDVNWNQANSYCSNLRQGGYSDWRLPTIEEMQGIYDPSVDVPGQSNGNAYTWHVKGNLKVSGFPWSSSHKNGVQAWLYAFNIGKQLSFRLSDSDRDRALCVRR